MNIFSAYIAAFIAVAIFSTCLFPEYSGQLFGKLSAKFEIGFVKGRSEILGGR